MVRFKLGNALERAAPSKIEPPRGKSQSNKCPHAGCNRYVSHGNNNKVVGDILKNGK